MSGMEISDIKALKPTTFDFAEKKLTSLEQKRQLLREAGAQADKLSNSQLARIGAALLHK